MAEPRAVPGAVPLPCAHDVLCADLQAVHLARRQVLHPLSLRVKAGRWTAIVGPNGAGKSTLLRTLAGLQPCEGQVTLMGRALAAWPAKARARQLAWLGQAESGADDLCVHDVVLLGRLPHQAWLASANQADLDAVEHAMRQTHCWGWQNRPLAQLSAGERQRVWLARALAVQAPILLMDEPLAHLDPPHQADWLGIVHRLREQGVAVVSVLHELNLALLADDLVLMAGGQLRHQGPPGDPATRIALQDIFDHRLQFFHVEGRWLATPHPGGT